VDGGEEQGNPRSWKNILNSFQQLRQLLSSALVPAAATHRANGTFRYSGVQASNMSSVAEEEFLPSISEDLGRGGSHSKEDHMPAAAPRSPAVRYAEVDKTREVIDLSQVALKLEKSV